MREWLASVPPRFGFCIAFFVLLLLLLLPVLPLLLRLFPRFFRATDIRRGLWEVVRLRKCLGKVSDCSLCWRQFETLALSEEEPFISLPIQMRLTNDKCMGRSSLLRHLCRARTGEDSEEAYT